MVSLDEFRTEFINMINISSIESSQHATDSFIDEMRETLIDDFSLVSDIENCFYEFTNGTKAYKNMQIDAGYLDLAVNSVDLLLADFNQGPIENINNEFINNKSRLMINFFENTLKGFFTEGEVSNPAVQLAFNIRSNIDSIYKLHLIIISTNVISQRVKTIELDDFEFNGKKYKVELDVIDIQKIYNSKLPTFNKEPIEINTKDFGIKGIQCIKADIGSTDYESYLAIVPGQFLCDIYKKYGPRLLESNVRSFLNAKGAVNKGIRDTIRDERDKFFTYNNGISTIAKSIEVENINNAGLYITKFNDFQIINGGQTTASLASADIRDHAPLDRIFVQMKLTILKEDNPEMVHYISQYANSQNKVTSADLNSNHPYYIKIEEFSRKIFAPPVNNSTYQTIWFFERARGQYDQPKMSMSKSERDKYTTQNPKNQKFSKTDLAKYLNSADMEPYNVSRGAEQNLVRFHEKIDKAWKTNKNDFSELYYKDLISKAILFKTIEKVISAQDWYIENKAYRAQLVTYTFSKLVYEVNSLKMEINYKTIWDKQTVPDYLIKDIEKIAKLAFDVFNDPNRTFSNIGEYTKRKDCWDALMAKKYELTEESKENLITKEEMKVAKISAKKEQKLSNSLMDSIQIYNFKPENWKRLLEEGKNRNLLSESECSFLEHAIKYSMGAASDIAPFQTKNIMEIKEKLEREGIK